MGNDGYPLENTSEVCVTKFEYSQDGRNLLIRKQESNGQVTLFSYLSNATLLSSKFICDGDQIKIRQFYEYNNDLILTREVIDNGSSPDPANLSGVTVRKIKTIIPISSGTFVNMPYVIEEKYWNGSGEVLLNKIGFIYDGQGRISQKHIYDSQGNFCYALKTSYDGHGNPVEETNAIGQAAKYAYDEVDNCIFSQDASGKKSMRMSYDFSNRLIQTEEAGIDGTKRITQHRYDGKHNKIASIDPYGNETRYVHDNLGHILETHLPSSTDLHPVLYSSYDDAGREIAQIDANGNTTTKQYNARNQVMSVTHPDGTEEHFIYNIDGTLKTRIDALGTTTGYTYDYLGRQTSITTSFQGDILTQEHFTYDGFNLLSKTDAEGNTTYYFYDGAGRKIAEELDGERINYSYDSLGRLHIVQKGDLLSITEYDLLNQVIEERNEDTSGTLLTKTLYAYDEAGNRSSITTYPHNKEAKEHFLYDAFNRLIQQVDALGHTTSIAYNDHYRNTQGQYVLQKTTTDPVGLQTIETFDVYGRLAATEVCNSFGELIKHEEQAFDANGNTIYHRDSRQVATLWEYDSMNRPISLAEAANTPSQKITRYSYTPIGQLDQTIKPDGTLIQNIYDPLGLLIELKSSDIHYSFRYNRLGQEIESRDMHTKATVLRTYDSHGRTLSETLPHNLTISKTYDDQGRRARLNLPDGSSVQYLYDALYTRSIHRLSSRGKTLYSHYYTDYDLSSNLLKQQLIGNAGTLTTTIDPLHRTIATHSSHFLQQITAFDAIGNILALSTQNTSQSFTYDHLYQLISENAHIYAYDSHSNRLQKDNEPYTLNVLNQIPSHYQYDDNGNPIADLDNHYQYDSLDRLISVQTPYHRVTFTYDAHHRRLTKTTYIFADAPMYDWIERETIHFLYDDDKEIGAADAHGSLLQFRVLHPDALSERGAAIALELNQKTYAPLHDLFGNIISLISLTGAPIETYSYTAFGEEQIFDKRGYSLNVSYAHNPWRYASKRIDEETGLIFFGRRYYTPLHGRWFTPDPAGYVDGYNLYSFVANNPFLNIDLYGLAIERSFGLNPDGSFEIRQFDPIKTLDHQPPSYSLSNSSYSYQQDSRDNDSSSRDISHVKNLAVASLDAAGRSLRNTNSFFTSLAPISNTPWSKKINVFEGAFEYCHSLHQKQLHKVLPEEERASYYDTVVLGESLVLDLVIARKASGELASGGLRHYIGKALNFIQGRKINGPACSSVNALKLKNSLISKEISGGHAFTKHVITRNEFGGFSQFEFEQHIRNIINNPTEMKILTRGRTAYWHQESRTVVIRDPLHRDGGTAFRPTLGKKYYDEVLK